MLINHWSSVVLSYSCCWNRTECFRHKCRPWISGFMETIISTYIMNIDKHLSHKSNTLQVQKSKIIKVRCLTLMWQVLPDFHIWDVPSPLFPLSLHFQKGRVWFNIYFVTLRITETVTTFTKMIKCSSSLCWHMCRQTVKAQHERTSTIHLHQLWALFAAWFTLTSVIISCHATWKTSITRQTTHFCLIISFSHFLTLWSRRKKRMFLSCYYLKITVSRCIEKVLCEVLLGNNWSLLGHVPSKMGLVMEQ